MQAAQQNTDIVRLAHLRVLWDRAPHPVWVHQNLRLVYVNQATVTALGATSANDLLGHSPLDFIAEESRSAVLARIQSMQQGGGAAPMTELSFKRLDGTPLPGQGVAWSIDFGGQPAIQASFYDSTAVSRAQAALLESERSRAQMIELLPQLVWTTAPDGTAEFFNQRWYDYTGLLPESSQGYGWAEALHPDDVERTVSGWSEAVGEDGHYEVEYRLRRADGTYRWFLARANPLRDAEGTITRWFGTSTDIDDQRRIEDRLRENEERFRTATRAVTELLWTNDADGLMHGEQEGWGAFTGQSQAEYQGYGWSKAVHPDDAQPTIATWNAAVAEKRMFVFEHRLRRHDGVYRLFRIRAMPILRQDGSIREWVGVHTDITERRAQLGRDSPPECGAGRSRAPTHSGARGQQPGTRRLQLLRLARSARAATLDRGFQSGTRGRRGTAVDAPDAGVHPTHTRGRATHGQPYRCPAATLARDAGGP